MEEINQPNGQVVEGATGPNTQTSPVDPPKKSTYTAIRECLLALGTDASAPTVKEWVLQHYPEIVWQSRKHGGYLTQIRRDLRERSMRSLNPSKHPGSRLQNPSMSAVGAAQPGLASTLQTLVWLKEHLSRSGLDLKTALSLAELFKTFLARPEIVEMDTLINTLKTLQNLAGLLGDPILGQAPQNASSVTPEALAGKPNEQDSPQPDSPH